jgi:hypothetical protein
MASVAGLAPARSRWKDGSLGLLCIHGQYAAGVGIAPTPAGFQPAVQTHYTIQRLVVPRGNAPRSSGYRPGALLLSYGTNGLATSFDGCHQAYVGVSR